MKKLFLLALFVVATSTYAAPAKPVIRVGERFPVLDLPRVSDGELVSTSTTHGKKYIVHLFASW